MSLKFSHWQISGKRDVAGQIIQRSDFGWRYSPLALVIIIDIFGSHLTKAAANPRFLSFALNLPQRFRDKFEGSFTQATGGDAMTPATAAGASPSRWSSRW